MSERRKPGVRDYLAWAVVFPLMFICIAFAILGEAADSMMDRLENVERVLRGLK